MKVTLGNKSTKIDVAAVAREMKETDNWERPLTGLINEMQEAGVLRIREGVDPVQDLISFIYDCLEECQGDDKAEMIEGWILDHSDTIIYDDAGLWDEDE